MKKIFHLDTKRLESIRKNPALAWDFFPATRIDLWDIPELDTDKGNLWDIDFIPCYSSQFFCVLLRINQTDMKAHDRAYQHGGGFVFQLAETREKNELTDVFTVFGTSPLEEREQLKWSRFFVYYKDIDLVFKRIEDAEIVVEIDKEYTYMLAMVPWYYADPLGPLRTKRIGFNIIVPQPIESENPVQYYSLISGRRIMAEQKLRDYVVYELEDPQPPSSGFEVDYALESKHFSKGEPGSVRFCVNTQGGGEITASIEADDATIATGTFNLSSGVNDLRLGFDTESLGTGRNQLRFNLTATSFEESFDLDVLIIDFDKISEIREKVSKISKQGSDNPKIKESLVAIEWKLELLEGEISALKPHQAPWNIQELIEQLERDMSHVEKGEDLFVRGEQIRLGLKSKQDGSLQPYSMYIPHTFEEGTSGLLVMLHGSGTNDERAMKVAEPLERFDEPGMMIVTPFARGESHLYLPEEAILEIIEVTEKMMDLFAIPKEKIILGGFSMGGLGVLGSFFKRPDLYHNLMLISAAMKIHEGAKLVKDYTAEDFLQKLAQANLVIFHGADDRNVSYADLKQVHERLLELNPDIAIHVAEGVGHQLSPEWGEKIMKFINNVGQARQISFG